MQCSACNTIQNQLLTWHECTIMSALISDIKMIYRIAGNIDVEFNLTV